LDGFETKKAPDPINSILDVSTSPNFGTCTFQHYDNFFSMDIHTLVPSIIGNKSL
jgi:hypothetical protein